MKKILKNYCTAKMISSFALMMVVAAANTRCAYIFHQPEQPESISKYSKA